jgi:hypothetical protein
MNKSEKRDLVRNIRKNFKDSFGGVQILLIGDMFQLPPVVKNDEIESLKKIYDSFYFFNSKVIQSHFPVYIELNKIYRQKEQQFVDVLNAVRTNMVNDEILNDLNKKVSDLGIENIKSEFNNLGLDNLQKNELRIKPEEGKNGSAKIKIVISNIKTLFQEASKEINVNF